MYLKDMTISTFNYIVKLFTNELFYIGSVIFGTIFYLTGLSVEQLKSVLIVIFLDIATRCWAEKKNNRAIMSRKMFYGFSGKFASYMILFTLANHAFYFKEMFLYAILGGFALIEFRSVYENLKDAGQNHLSIIANRIDNEIGKFEGSTGSKEKPNTPKI